MSRISHVNLRPTVQYRSTFSAPTSAQTPSSHVLFGDGNGKFRIPQLPGFRAKSWVAKAALFLVTGIGILLPPAIEYHNASSTGQQLILAGIAHHFDPQDIEAKMIFQNLPKPVAISQLKDKQLQGSIDNVYFESTLNPQVKLHGWYIPAKPGQPTIVFSNGTENTIDFPQHLMSLCQQQGIGFLVYEYPGYGNSQGHPSQTAHYNALESAIHYLDTKKGVSQNQMVLMGISLGGTVTAHVAGETTTVMQNGKPVTVHKYPVKLVVLLETPSSVRDVYRGMLQKEDSNWMVKLLAADPNSMVEPFDAAKDAKTIYSPVLLIGSNRDQTAVPGMQKELASDLTHASPKDVDIHANLGLHGNVMNNPQALQHVMDDIQTMLAQIDAQQSAP